MKNLSERVVQLAGRVDSFMKRRTIIAVLMLYQGVMLLVESGNTTRGMAMGIAIAIVLAAGGIIAEVLAKQGGSIKALIPAILAVCLAAYIYFQPDLFAGILQYLIAASVLMTGLLNLAQAFGISAIRRQGNEGGSKAVDSETHGKGDTMAGTIRKTVKNAIDERTEPTRLLLSRLGKSIAPVWVTGFLMTALGIFLFFRSVEGNSLLAIVCGIVMITTSLSDLVAAYKMKKALKAGQTTDPALSGPAETASTENGTDQH